jgi:hypothetical protein
MKVTKGDTVAVRSGVSDPDFGTRIDGWRGRVVEVDEDAVTVTWDSVTLEQMGMDLIIRCENENLDWRVMTLSVDEVEAAQSRDVPSDVERMAHTLWERARGAPRLQDEE